MTYDPKLGRYCDECGRSLVNAVKIHRGKEFCRACYQRVFVPKPCSRCGTTTRAHRYAASVPVCPACERSSRTCLRCGRFVVQAGKLVGDGAVCEACAPYFRERRQCPGCGRMTSRLSRPLFAELSEAVCDSCREKLTHATCSGCSRYRPIEGRKEDGKPFCRDCIPGREVSHLCPDCDRAVPGGGLGRCRTCLNRARVRHNASLVAARLEYQWVREIWLAFVEDQIGKVSDNPLFVRQIERASEFLLALESAFSSPAEINSHLLLSRFGSKFLRKHLVISRFVVARLRLDQFDAARTAVTEDQRVTDILERAAEKPHGALLNTYVEDLRDSGVSTRTIRLYLRAAEAFCLHQKVENSRPWRDGALHDYLAKAPGHTASLFRFVTYCRRHMKWEVEMPKWSERPTSVAPAVRDLGKLETLLASVCGQPKDRLSTKILARLFSLSLGVPATTLLKERKDGIPHCRPDGSIYLTGAAVVTQDNPLFPFASRWIELSSRKVAKSVRVASY